MYFHLHFLFLADLEQGAVQFRKGASGVRRQMYWKNMKMRLLIALGVIILLVIIIGKRDLARGTRVDMGHGSSG